jgi:hypothetical protein
MMPGSGEAYAEWGAVPRSEEYLSSLREVLDRADTGTVPSHILHLCAPTFSSVKRFDGSIGSEGVAQRRWEQHYHDLQRSIVKGSSLADRLIPLEELKAQARIRAEEGVTPIVVFDLEYHYPGPRLVTAVLRAARDDRAVRLPADPEMLLQQGRAVMASALLPDRFEHFSLLPPVHEGREIRFRLDRESILTNTSDPVTRVDADFGDGGGFRTVALGQDVVVRYEDDGPPPTVRLRLHHADGLRYAAFSLEVTGAPQVPTPITWPIQATIPYLGQTNSGTAYVLYGSTNGQQHTQLVNPIMISEGFPGGYSWSYLYTMLNAEGLLTSLLNEGYDAVVLTYANGADYVQRNAFVAVACIQKIIAARAGSQPLVVGGASMGGLVTRYALWYMEQNGLDHQTAQFLSFDSPQQGGHVPPGDQWFIQAFAEQGDATAKTLAALLSSPAARQMLYYCVPSYMYSGPLTDPLHLQLFSGLGYPQRPTTIAVADGAGNGQQIIPDLAHTLDWYGNVCANGDAWSLATSSLPATPQICELYLQPLSTWSSFTFNVWNVTNLDGAPGGLTNANGSLADSIIDSDYGWVSHWYDTNCFIPTISSLDITNANGNPYITIPSEGAATAFDVYLVSAANNPHVAITPEIATFLLAQLQLPTDPEPAALEIAEGVVA